MAIVAEKVVRMSSASYDFVTDFANEHDLKISEAVDVLIRFCKGKDLVVKQTEIQVMERQYVASED